MPGAPVGEQVEPRRRLHPLTPLLRGGRLAVVVIAALSWRFYQDVGTVDWLLAAGGVAVLLILGSLVSYLVTGYHVVGRELRIYEGLLVRRTRAIPVDRLQSVELVRPLVARLVGLAELRLEVVGGQRTEAPLAFLTLDDATALRARLLAARTATQSVPAQYTPAAPLAAASADVPVHQVANGQLVGSQLLRPQWWLLPVAVALPIVALLQDGHGLQFIAIASTVTAVIGAVLAPLRVLFGDWGFNVVSAPDGLHIRRGLTETHVNTVPPGRIQSVAVEWPLLWRMAGWVRASMHIAGVRDSRQGPHHTGLLPVGTVGAAQTVLAAAVPGFVLTDVAVHPVPRRAWVLAPLRWLVLGFQVGPVAFVCRDGLFTRRLVIVPYGRIQSVRVTQGPVQRVLGLASVHVDVAGGGEHRGAALYRDVAEAKALATDLADRSRAARRG
jgi:putative membrane protein